MKRGDAEIPAVTNLSRRQRIHDFRVKIRQKLRGGNHRLLETALRPAGPRPLLGRIRVVIGHGVIDRCNRGTRPIHKIAGLFYYNFSDLALLSAPAGRLPAPGGAGPPRSTWHLGGVSPTDTLSTTSRHGVHFTRFEHVGAHHRFR